MKASRFVAKNTALLTIGLFSGRILGYVIFRRLTGIEGPEGTGVWATAVDLTAIMIVVSNFGLGAIATREIVKARENTAGIFKAALRIRLSLAAVAYALLVAYAFASGYDDLVRTAIIVTGLGILIETVCMACDAVLQAHEKVQHQTSSQIVSAFVYFALAWWWIDVGHGVLGILWANVACRLARLLVIAPLMMKHTGPWRGAGTGSDGVGARWLAKLALPMFLATTFGMIALKIDTIMIMEILGDYATGIYGAGHRPLDLLMMLPYLFATALFPSLQRYRESGEKPLEDVRRMAERALRYIHLVIFPITMVGVLGAAPLMRILTEGDEFGPAADVLRIVILGLTLNAGSTIYNRVLLALGLEKAFVRIGLTALIVNVSLNLVLIPTMRWHGAAIATVLSQIVIYAMHRRALRGSGVSIPWTRAYVRGTAALLAAWAVVAGLLQVVAPGWGAGWTHLPETDWVGFVVAGLLTAVVYAGALFVFGALRREDVVMIRDLRRAD